MQGKYILYMTFGFLGRLYLWVLMKLICGYELKMFKIQIRTNKIELYQTEELWEDMNASSPISQHHGR